MAGKKRNYSKSFRTGGPGANPKKKTTGPKFKALGRMPGAVAKKPKR